MAVLTPKSDILRMVGYDENVVKIISKNLIHLRSLLLLWMVSMVTKAKTKTGTEVFPAI